MPPAFLPTPPMQRCVLATHEPSGKGCPKDCYACVKVGKGPNP